MNSDPRAPVTLEEVLRLKRLERPPTEFWTQFESELRAKQLAAIVGKRPWWTASSRFFGIFSHYQVPLGAAAALAAVVVGGFHEYRTLTLGSARRSVDDGFAAARPDLIAAATSSDASSAAAGKISSDSTRLAAGYPKVAVDRRVADRHATAPRAVQVAVVADGGAVPVRSSDSHEIDAVFVGSDFSNRNWTGRMDSLSDRSIALNLPASRATEPEAIRNLFGFTQNLDSNLVPERPPVSEPLAQMTSPSEEDRARRLAEVLPVAAASAEAPPPLSDRFASRLRDDRRLYESISQYGVGGDHSSLQVKF